MRTYVSHLAQPLTRSLQKNCHCYHHSYTGSHRVLKHKVMGIAFSEINSENNKTLIYIEFEFLI